MSETKYRKKLIEVALPLEVINRESAREKSIRHGHPSTLHLWWARRPLAAARAVLFAQLVDDPSAWPELFPSEAEQDAERKRIFKIIEEMVPWEASNNAEIIDRARREIARSWARNHRSGRATRILAEDATADEINDYLATELPPVHDPFAGGGSIPLEAQRLGLRAIASDLNPVAVLINKALIEIPRLFAGMPPVNPESRAGRNRPKDAQAGLDGTGRRWKAAQGIAADVRYYGSWMREEAERRIGHLYPKVEVTAEAARKRPELAAYAGTELPAIAWLWARTVTSPDPAFAGIHVPLVSTFWLSKRTGQFAWIQPVVEERSYRFEIRTGLPGDKEGVDAGTKVGRGANFRCLLSGAPITPAHIKSEGMAKRMGTRLMAVVAEGKKARLYLAPTESMELAARTVQTTWTPEQDLPKNPRWFSPPDYGMPTFADLFTPRQLVALTTYSDLVVEARDHALADACKAGRPSDERSLHMGGRGSLAYAEAIMVYLSFAFDKMLDTNTSLCTWQTNPTRLRSTFGRQALPMTWDFAEANPFSDAAGDYSRCIDTQRRAIENLGLAISERASAKVCTEDATKVEERRESICSTDPPYYDNIGYADLSDFFYIWLRRNLRSVFPAEMATLLVPKQAELIASFYRHGGRLQAESFFLSGMSRALESIARSAIKNELVTIYYAFKQSEPRGKDNVSTGWETFLQAVIDSGFRIQGTWPVRTEWATRIVGSGTNALASSIVLACGLRQDDAPICTRNDFRRHLQRELPAALRALQHGNVAPVDLAQAALGPGMAVFSRFEKVLEADGSRMVVRAALQLVNEMLDEHLTAHDGELDADSRFAITWYEHRGFEAGPYGDAETLAKARAISVEGIVEAGIVRSGGGKVRLLKRSELPEDWDPTTDSRLTVWEATQHLIKRLEEDGEESAAVLLGELGALAGPARDLAYRLYATCERKGWREEARAYNGLVIAWPDLERLASQAGSPPSRPFQEALL